MANTNAFRIRRKDSEGSTQSGIRKKLRFESDSDGVAQIISQRKDGSKIELNIPSADKETATISKSLPTRKINSDPATALAAAEAAKKARLARLGHSGDTITKQNPIQVVKEPDLNFDEEFLDKLEESDQEESEPMTNIIQMKQIKQNQDTNEEDETEQISQGMMNVLGDKTRSIVSDRTDVEKNLNTDLEDLIIAMEKISDPILEEPQSNIKPEIDEYNIAKDQSFQEHELKLIQENSDFIPDNGVFVAKSIPEWSFHYDNQLVTYQLLPNTIEVYYIKKGYSDYCYEELITTVRGLYRNGIIQIQPVNSGSVYSNIFEGVLKQVYQWQGQDLMKIPSLYYTDETGSKYYVVLLDQQIRLKLENYYMLAEVVYNVDSKLMVEIKAFILINSKVLFSLKS